MTTSSRLPTGTVTFLFTDVEGSTRMAQATGDDWPALLAIHDRILRDAITSAGGTVVKTEGDGFFAVFASPREAVAAVVDAQRALAQQDWPGGHRLTVRMGVHTGLGTLGGDDYVGIDVHRGARIAAAAHGGQVVLSEPTAALVRRELPAGVSLRDLGEHRLKDLDEPEAVFQLVVDGLNADFPPLRTLDFVKHSLPLPVTSFVGRRAELARALELLENTRLLTITGPGGTGKTRLALELAAELGPAFRDGTAFVDLAPILDPDLVASQVLRALGAQSASGTVSPHDVLLERLRDRELLLILDNFEQVLAAAPLVAELVQAAPDSRFVVTSRGPLRVAAERVMPLEPMTVPHSPEDEVAGASDAVQLFVQRAMAVRPDFRLTAENAPTVAELVRRLDGLPLAIELVASRVRILPVAEILARLDPASLGTGAVDLPERQRTIQGAIAWSHDLLDEPVRRIFARFGVFAGGADLPQVERVCLDDAGGPGLFDALGELVDQGLVRQVGGSDRARFRMLAVIREYALARLAESGEADAVQRRHAQAYADWAEEMGTHLMGADRKDRLDRFEADHDNVRAALDWATANGEVDLALRLGWASWRFWQSRGHLHEGRRRLEAALALSGAAPENRSKGLEALGGIRWWQGEIAEAVPLYREALEIDRELGDPARVANALYNLGIAEAIVAFTDGTATEEVRRTLEERFAESERISRSLGDENGLANVAWGRGNAISLLDDYAPEALEQFKRSVEHYRRAGNEFGTGWGMYEVATFALHHDDLETAREYLVQGLTLFARHRDISAAVLLISLAADLAQAEGDPVRAARLSGAVRALRNASGTTLVDHAIVRSGVAPGDEEPEDPELLAAFRAGAAMDLDEAVASVIGTDAGTNDVAT